MNKISAKSNDMLYLQTKHGVVEIKLKSEIAPKTVEQITRLADEGFYDGIVFHRVIDGFMAQTGDPTGTGTGGSGKNIVDEFSSSPHNRGIVSMANSGQTNSQDSQFFIVLKDATFLDGKYTVFGEVINGMEFVDKIKLGEQHNNGMVVDPDKIVKMSTTKITE
ncbi:MAG: peptidylprolyl isomerase [Alphaproteobacteria bacterium]|nr:peptidylprolyl isomerase [Alphaproteobacteria bacterium]MBL0717741.1 peptidylprolyl isomerase [Alphaproteobacteria bacterium]